MKKKMNILCATKLPVVIGPFIFHPLSEGRNAFQIQKSRLLYPLINKTVDTNEAFLFV